MARFEASKQALVDSIVVVQQPKVIVSQNPDSEIRLAPHLEREKAKEPVAQFDGSRFPLRMTFCSARMDDGHWSWGEPRGWRDQEWTATIEPAMTLLAGLTWGEIDQFSSDGGHKVHHGHDISDLIDEAQERWLAIDLEQFDTVFRFRIGGQRQRVWGFVIQAHFHTVWADRSHNLYPTGED